MELQEFKKAWTNQKAIGYSPEELNSIYYIKQLHNFTNLKTGWSWDLILSIIIAVVFIAALQVLDFRTSNFWSGCMAILGLQHILFYQIQLYLLRKYSAFNNNIRRSLSKVIDKVRILLWFYRLWPAVLTISLSFVYVVQFRPQQPLWITIISGALLALVVAILANILSAVLVRKHLLKLEGLKKDLEKLNEEAD